MYTAEAVVVLTRGVEPPRVSPYGPEPYASAIPPRERRAEPAGCKLPRARPTARAIAPARRLTSSVVCGRAFRRWRLCAFCLTTEGGRRNSKRRSRNRARAVPPHPRSGAIRDTIRWRGPDRLAHGK